MKSALRLHTVQPRCHHWCHHRSYPPDCVLREGTKLRMPTLAHTPVPLQRPRFLVLPSSAPASSLVLHRPHSATRPPLFPGAHMDRRRPRVAPPPTRRRPRRKHCDSTGSADCSLCASCLLLSHSRPRGSALCRRNSPPHSAAVCLGSSQCYGDDASSLGATHTLQTQTRGRRDLLHCDTAPAYSETHLDTTLCFARMPASLHTRIPQQSVDVHYPLCVHLPLCGLIKNATLPLNTCTHT